MRRIDLKVGNECNNNCLFCGQKKSGEPIVTKNPDELKREIIKAKEEGCNIITLTGGEPTIFKHLIDLAEFAKSCSFDIIQIQTNGRMLSNPKFARRLISAGINEFCFSIHGSNEDTHDKLTQSPGSFRQAIEGMKNVSKENCRIITNTVITKDNNLELPKVAELLVHNGTAQIQFAYPQPRGNASINFRLVMEKMSSLVPSIYKAIEICDKAEVGVMLESIPSCIVMKDKDYSAENIMPSTKVVGIGKGCEDYKEVRASGKVKRDECSNCLFNDICEGVWIEYINAFGWDEFIPVKDKLSLEGE